MYLHLFEILRQLRDEVVTVWGHKYTGGSSALDDALQLPHNGAEGRQAKFQCSLPMLITVPKALWRCKQVGAVLHMFTSSYLTVKRKRLWNTSLCHFYQSLSSQIVSPVQDNKGLSKSNPLLSGVSVIHHAPAKILISSLHLIPCWSFILQFFGCHLVNLTVHVSELIQLTP